LSTEFALDDFQECRPRLGFETRLQIVIGSRQIEALLGLGSLDDAEAHRRASILADDIEQIGFDTFQLSCRPYPIPLANGRTSATLLPEYHFGDTGFTVQKARNSHDDFSPWIGGTGLDRGHLQFFSKVSQLGHRLIPQFWPKHLRSELRNPTQHLDTLEEVWWLGCWSGVENIRRAERIQSDFGHDIDWQFTIGNTGLSSALKVNLEVKRLKSDNLRQARGREMNTHEFAQFCSEQVLKKFRPSRADEVNVLAISLFGEIDENVQRIISEWLLSNENSDSDDAPLIDAVLLATRESRRRSSWDKQLRNEKAKLIKSHFRGPDVEDESFFFVFDVPYKIPGLPV
jgi:hypothetical protein